MVAPPNPAPQGRRAWHRRSLLSAAAMAGLLAPLPLPYRAAAASSTRELTADRTSVALDGPGQPSTAVWAYDGQVAGPLLRVRQGDSLALRFVNRLPQPSTIHWHGIRIDNAMDGVAGLTQSAVEPNESFDYRFTLPDAGTFWYHPHNRSWEQVARGLYGLLIVEEAEPPFFDQDLVFLADDWRLDEGYQIHEASFGQMRDWSHAGRLGNWLTINSRSRPEFAVRSGERIRLRLVNTATARVMVFAFPDHAPRVIALDGQPVVPHDLPAGRAVLAPGARMDLALDAEQDPGSRTAVLEVSQQQPVEVAQLVYGPVARRPAALPNSIALPSNPLPRKLDLSDALDVELRMEGGAMGGLAGADYKGETLDIRSLVSHGQAWAFNGVAGMSETPLFSARQGQTVRLSMHNDTRWPHAIHQHGHHVRLLSRNGVAVDLETWHDTLLLNPDERVEVALLADNPGKWMLHCHMLEHQAAGMATWYRVEG